MLNNMVEVPPTQCQTIMHKNQRHDIAVGRVNRWK